MFMSYFIELPGLDTAGLGKVWDSLDVVAREESSRMTVFTSPRRWSSDS